MSVLIRGMDMPKNCWKCPFRKFWDDEDQCLAKKNLWVKGNEIPPVCPLIELPPHGRLGDLDRLEQMFVDIDNAPYSGFDGENPFYSAEDAAQIIRLAPTIIESEE